MKRMTIRGHKSKAEQYIGPPDKKWYTNTPQRKLTIKQHEPH